MRISYSAFPAHLEKDPASFYFLFGNEILLVEESLDQLRQSARGHGFTERVCHTVDQHFDWNQIFSGGQSMSLFAEKQMTELRLPTGKPGDQGAKALTEYANMPQSPDNMLVVISGPIEKRSQSNKWFSAVEKTAMVVEAPEVSSEQLPKWIAHRMQGQGMKYEREAVIRLAQYVEGNLLAASQEINLLGLLAEDGQVTLKLVENTIADHARFSSFNFADACLAGRPERVTRILGSLRLEQAEPILILWALTRDARALCQLAAIRDQGGNPKNNFQKLGIWGSRANDIGAALRRLSLQQCQSLLRRLAKADLQVKGQTPLERKDIWEEIEKIGLGICGVWVA